MSLPHDYNFDILTATADDLRQLLDSDRITSVHIVQRCVRQIERYNEKLRAIICVPTNLEEVAQHLD
jgi:amidase